MKPLKHLLLIVLATVLSTSTNAPALTTNLLCVADTGLFEFNPANNLGGMTYVTAGTTGIPSRSRALFKFDVATALPANSTVTNATLSLTIRNANGFGQSFGLHRVLNSWGEGTGSGQEQGVGLGSPANVGDATWNARFHPDTLWDEPGGKADVDYVTTASASQTLDALTIVFTSEGLAADVQSWLDNPGSNSGWLLKVVNESTTATASQFVTREDPQDGPVLTVEYTVSAPPPALTLFDGAIAGNEMRLSFNAESNLTYAVEFNGDLNGTNWTVLTNIPASVETATILISDPLTGSNRFYRTRTP